jgi:hypothetical protein
MLSPQARNDRATPSDSGSAGHPRAPVSAKLEGSGSINGKFRALGQAKVEKDQDGQFGTFHDRRCKTGPCPPQSSRPRSDAWPSIGRSLVLLDAFPSGAVKAEHECGRAAQCSGPEHCDGSDLVQR